jgi:(E)-4-hydroxy-3-methylbut-2-enyl-diphosphate synthase
MLSMGFKYCNSLSEYSRFETREVMIGNVPMGGKNPIRIQSMTNTNTLDTMASVEQCIRIIEAGADYVRLTAPGVQDAENLANIKAELYKRGYTTPLIADIHYNPKAAEVAAAIVEKVRINPGNYSDKKRFEQLDFTEVEYNDELAKISQKLKPLLEICKTHNTAIRIGVNHGSLSDRIMSRYGDTPNGMVEAAMEFLRICASENFHNIVVSLKASNTRIMVQAYRLLVNTMMAEGMNYPLHLGVTEAGDGEDGRIRSAVGIGTLLSDGLGDTIRVSLTEDPEAEIPIALQIRNYFQSRINSGKASIPITYNKNPFVYEKRESKSVVNIGGNNQPIVIVDWNELEHSQNQLQPDYYYLNSGTDVNTLPNDKLFIYNLHDWFLTAKHKTNVYPFYTDAEFAFYGPKHPTLNFVVVSAIDISEKLIHALKNATNVVLIIETFCNNGVADQRSLFLRLLENGIQLPVIINRNYIEDSEVQFQLKAASDLGLLLIDGFGDGIWLRNAGEVSYSSLISASFGILQASRVRTTKTEYISCPSCGRTMFDLQSVTAEIKARTGHLKHLKIGIMGCIVNGPGEMADADYGYVGAAAGKVTLYKGKNVIKKNIPSKEAVDELLQIIKNNNDWLEP